MMIDTGSKVIFSNTLVNACDLKVKVTDLEIFNIKVFKELIFSKPYDGFAFIFAMMIDTGPKFYSIIPPPMLMTSRSRSQIQEGQLSVSGERMCTILVNRLED